MSKTYQLKDITIVQENTNLPGVFIEYLMSKIQAIRNAHLPDAQIELLIAISGDHLYNFRAEIKSRNENKNLTTTNNDPFNAIDSLLKEIKNLAQQVVN